MKIIVMKSRKLSRGRENNLAKVNVNILTPFPKVAAKEARWKTYWSNFFILRQKKLAKIESLNT